MARIFDEIDEWEPYVPGIDGGRERELFLDDPDTTLTVEIKFLSKNEKDSYARIARRAERMKTPGKSEEEHIRRLFRDHVRNVRNYVFNGVPVTGGEELFDASDADLTSDVVMAMMDRSSLERGLAKKLRSPSVTPSLPRKTSAVGAALAVTGVLPQALQAILNHPTSSYSSTTLPSAGSATVTGTTIPTSPLPGRQA